MKTVIIIPVRMASKRFPNKPLALINGVPMIQRVWQQAIKSKFGDVYVACADREIYDLINSLGGTAIMTDPDLTSGTDRVYAALKKIKNYSSYESVINLQGDMPIINPKNIIKVNEPIYQGFDIGTLVTNITKDEERNINITKAKIKWLKKNKLGEALDFYKNSKNNIRDVYHHVGIYSFKIKSLNKFVSISPSLNELKFKLEQWRALDSSLSIGVSYVKNVPISIDTKEDLISVESIIKTQND